jgi:hypothetical protein
VSYDGNKARITIACGENYPAGSPCEGGLFPPHQIARERCLRALAAAICDDFSLAIAYVAVTAIKSAAS